MWGPTPGALVATRGLDDTLAGSQAAFPTGPQLGPTGAQLGPTLAQPGPIWNAAWDGTDFGRRDAQL